MQVVCGNGPCNLACNSHPEVCESLEFGCGTNDSKIDCNDPLTAFPTLIPPERPECLCELDDDCDEA